MTYIHNSSFMTPYPKLLKEEINPADSFSQQPQDIIYKIFSCLDPEQLANCGKVSRKWRRLASDDTLWNAFDLKKISPLLRVIDESDWITHVDLSSFGLNVKDALPPDKRKEIPILKRCLSSLSLEGNSGITLLTIPQGLSFNKLVKLAGSPKRGYVTTFRHIRNLFSREMGDIQVEKTYRIVITNNIFENSRKSSLKEQHVLLSKSGFKRPKVLEATALLVMTYMSSGQRLLPDKPATYTLCSECLSGYQMGVGNFSPMGPGGGRGIAVYYDHYVSRDFGVGGVLQI